MQRCEAPWFLPISIALALAQLCIRGTAGASVAANGRSVGGLRAEPPPQSVIFGDIRVQALSPNVLRVERKGPRGFEDAPTFLVQQRTLSDPAAAPVHMGSPKVGGDGVFNLSIGLGTSALLLQVSPRPQDTETCWTQEGVALFPVRSAAPSVYAADAGACCDACSGLRDCTSFYYTGPRSPAAAPRPRRGAAPRPGTSCAHLHNDTDVSVHHLLPSKPSRPQCNVSLVHCCALCDADAACVAFEYTAPSSWSACPQLPYCFLLSGFAGTKTKKGNVLGTKAPLPPAPSPSPPNPAPGPGPPPSPRANCQLNAGYGESHIGGGLLGCPRRGCASAWSGRWQGGDLGKSFQQPALGLHARVLSPSGDYELGSSAHATAPFAFPSPSKLPPVFALRDSPRFLVPPGGAVPQAHVEPALANTSGYDIRIVAWAPAIWACGNLFLKATKFTLSERGV